MTTAPRVDYQTAPAQYKHLKLTFDGPVATLAVDIDENAGLRPGYKLKLNSYDLGVDIELNDALNRVRFEHPEVRTVVVTSGKDKVFCSGANIFMLGVSSHAWKVNFCKFTNETRNGIEDSSQHSGLKFLAAVNGACAGGGYELALACDEILLVDDRSSAVSLPEVPLLGVLPGTGGLTRVTDKRHVRHDLADIFCTTTEGVRGQRAKDWRLVDDIAKPAVFAQKVQERALALAAQSDRPADAQGVALEPIERTIEADALRYMHVTVEIDRAGRTATFTVKAPVGAQPQSIEEIVAAGAAWYPLQLARELEDAILSMRTNELDIGTWLIKTSGDAAAVLATDAALLAHKDHWLVRETIGLLRRTLSRLDVSSRSLFALIEPQSCFAGTFLELALACDRSYHLALPDDEERAPKITVAEVNFGLYPMATGQSRLGRRFYDEQPALDAVRAKAGQPLDADAAYALGLVTANPDDIDWTDEVRIALEERVAMSPDALTGMEANLRFNGQENMFTRIFGRLTAWQNWIFQRPNAVGDKGALKVYGKGDKAAFDWNRV
ncbi:2,3-epoxybenzoyl-CoA dihydrolase [Cupriavidus necator]|uniref:Benzoyl-CoA-dihydrodiol lyase n=1 Tax=Cupriavidus necator (strain ATCC 17699 / DSM 428 / KCTC 22496 / NCIMB 10442 / H16 / Stanier 337) TaxID=381666 RepID=Q0JZX8_CUPNH|nr:MULTISPECIES: 2,3-epoxybenzoyl-CoA dihydrolase [Cupriavidus]EON18088.1 benzoyl-CoA-dihydrodiol lyase [Cupriavidus sp. GA3-3]KUE90759.1 benzoyl-CoA-dihydrodiol lyase [Cupriavidus necator]QCC04515.1 benzoyl-CoA-dihydrodiol lyase [Cupriavidus necator H16]QQB79207.1 benzoyl-CoA-dihydrodiol lyase [Cupriavidus necator]WKA43429.1 2,3-epoxybenzoyl-CoA dihydrolase [Cupriavidus necator]